MYSTPSAPDPCRRYFWVRSSLRSPLSKGTKSTPSRSAKRSNSRTKLRVRGASRTEEGTGKPQMSRRK